MARHDNQGDTQAYHDADAEGEEHDNPRFPKESPPFHGLRDVPAAGKEGVKVLPTATAPGCSTTRDEPAGQGLLRPRHKVHEADAQTRDTDRVKKDTGKGKKVKSRVKSKGKIITETRKAKRGKKDHRPDDGGTKRRQMGIMRYIS